MPEMAVRLARRHYHDQAFQAKGGGHTYLMK